MVDGKEQDVYVSNLDNVWKMVFLDLNYQKLMSRECTGMDQGKIIIREIGKWTVTGFRER